MHVQPAAGAYVSNVVGLMDLGTAATDNVVAEGDSMWHEPGLLMCASDDELHLPPCGVHAEADARSLSQDSWVASPGMHIEDKDDQACQAADAAAEWIDADWLDGVETDYIPSPTKASVPAREPKPAVRPRNEAVRLLYARVVPSGSRPKRLGPPKL